MMDTSPSLAAATAVTDCRAASPPARALLALIWLYRRTLSPALPVITLGRCACRFSPTCSVYAAQAIRRHGALVGAWLAVCRLVKCTPLYPGGLDPVPAAGRAAPRCVRTTPPSAVRPSRLA